MSKCPNLAPPRYLVPPNKRLIIESTKKWIKYLMSLPEETFGYIIDRPIWRFFILAAVTMAMQAAGPPRHRTRIAVKRPAPTPASEQQRRLGHTGPVPRLYSRGTRVPLHDDSPFYHDHHLDPTEHEPKIECKDLRAGWQRRATPETMNAKNWRTFNEFHKDLWSWYYEVVRRPLPPRQ